MKLPAALSIFLVGALWAWETGGAGGVSCESCGAECAAACGTRNFRACCFNYLKKRTPADAAPPAAIKLQLWLAKTSHELRHGSPRPRPHRPRWTPAALAGDQADPDLPEVVGPHLLHRPELVPAVEDELESRLQLIYDV